MLMFTVIAASLIAAVSAARDSPVAVDDKLVLWQCDLQSQRQSWNYGNGTGTPYSVSVRGGSLVWDIIGPSNDTGTGIHAWGFYSPARGNQQWNWNPNKGQLRSFWGKCLGVRGPALFGTSVVLVDCNEADPSQKFAFDNSTGVFSMASAVDGSDLCVDAGSQVNCTTPPFNAMPYCNSSLGAGARAKDLASRLGAWDWASLLQNSNNGVPRFGVKPITYDEALHGQQPTLHFLTFHVGDC